MSTTLTVKIGGTVVPVVDSSLQIITRVDDKDKCNFQVYDASGTAVYQKGQTVSVVDTTIGTLFTGFVNKPKAAKLYPQSAQLWTVDCVSQFYHVTKHASKKRYHKRSGSGYAAGAILADQIQRYLAPDGVTGNFSLSWTEQQNEWSSATLTNAVAATNVTNGNPSGGNLELSSAGGAVTFSQQSQADFNAGFTGGGLSSPSTGGLTFTPTQAIKLTGSESVASISNAHSYMKIWSGSYTIAAGDVLIYDVWIADSCPQQQAAVDFVLTDGTTLRDNQSIVGVDAQGIGPHPNNNLAGLATNTWYHRQFAISGGSSQWVGKTIAYVSVAFEGNNQGAYTAYFRNVLVMNGSTTKLTIFGSNATTTAIVPQQLQNSGYINMACTVVTSYERHGYAYSPHFALTSAGIVQSSFVAWSISLPNSSFTFSITAAVDGSATFLPCTLNAAIPGLLPGENAPSYVVFVYVFDNAGNDPTLTPLLSRVAGQVNPAYVCSKSDITSKTNTSTGWSSGTLTNLINSASNTLQINGAARNWDDGNVGSITGFGTSAVFGALDRQFYVTSLATNFAISRFDFAGQWADFTAEIDLVATTGVLVGLIYRTGSTALSNNDGCYAYAIELNTTSIKLQRGTNSSGGGTATTVGTATLSLTSGTSYHLKIVVAGSSHTVYLNDTAYITATDGTYVAAGYLGVRNRNTLGTAQTATFDNFGVVAALSGTWVSPAIDIHSLGTISDSQITLQIDPGVPLSTNSFLVEISLNNGSTWTTCTNTLTGTSAAFPTINGGYFQAHAVPGLTAGTNVSGMTQVKIRLTITAATASFGQTVAASAAVVPNITAVTLIVLGSYSSTGTRSNAPLGNDTYKRGNQSGFGTSTDQQTYTVQGPATLAIASNAGTITGTGLTDIQLGSTTATDQSMSTQFSLGNTASLYGVDARYTNASGSITTYRAYVQSGNFVLDKRVSGTVTSLQTVAFALTAGTAYKIRLVCQGTTIQARIWLASGSEPTTWQLSQTDSSIASGGVALSANMATSDTATVTAFFGTLWPDPTQYLTSAGRATSSLVDHNSLLPTNTAVTIQTSTDGGATYQTAAIGGGIPGVATLLSSTATLQRKPAAFYRLDDTGSSAADSSGNGRTGTLNGTITKSVTGALQGPGEASDTAMTFDGSTGYIALPTGIVPTSHDFSIALWVKVNSFAVDGGGLQRRILINNIDGTNAFQLCTQAVDTSFIWACNDSTGQVISSHPGFSTGVWYHVVGTWTAGTRTTTLYVNATAYPGNDSGASGFGLGTTTGFNLARRPDGAGYFPGTLDEATVFTTALSAADATALYNAGAVAVGQTIDDTYTSDTHTNYTQTFGSGGAAATWTWDTANSRVVAVGGTKAQLLYNNLWAYDVALMADFTQSENSGLIWGWQNSSNYYTLVVCDSAGSTPNTLTVYKVSGGTTTQLASGAISFTPGSYHRVNMSMLAGVITASFDNVQILTYTDSSPFPAGQCGLRNDTGTSYIYELQIQPQAPDVSGLAVYTKHTLSSTDPTATPQLLDAQTMASDSTFGNGSSIATAEYNQAYVSDNVDDLNTQSNYSYAIDFNKNITFTARQAKNAPWIMQSTDIQVANATVEYSGDLYRNRQTLKGVYQTSTYTEIKQGDSSTRTWNTANPITMAPTIQLNGMTASVGVLNVDTGKQFYWQVGSTAITQDNSQPILQKNLDSFTVVYTGTSAINFTVDNTGGFPGTISQSQMAALDNSTGVVESIEDVSQKNMNVAAATAYANQLLARYGNIARTLTATTLHAGLKPGHNLPIFIPELNIFDSYFLVVEVTTTARLISTPSGAAIQYVYQIVASEAAALSSWVKFFSKIMRSIK